MPDVDICVGDPIHIDETVFQFWLKGLSVNDAARQLGSLSLASDQARNPAAQLHPSTTLGSPDELRSSLLASETSDQYFSYGILEQWLTSVPPTLDAQTIIPLPASVQANLIDLYFSFDEHCFVVRELLGKKLSSRLRNNLDDIADKTGVPLKSCRRQFDNVRRVFRDVEDKPGCLVENIQRKFLLSTELASKYATVVFMANSKFETGKKRLNYLTFSDFHVCAENMIDSWTAGAEGEQDPAANVDTDVDRTFLQMLKEVRSTVEVDIDAQRILASQYLQQRLPGHPSSTLEQHFKQLNKSLLKISEGLVHKTELKDFFSDLEEKFIDPCRQWEYSADDMALFVNAMLETAKQLEQLSRRRNLQQTYEKYLKTVLICVRRFASTPKR